MFLYFLQKHKKSKTKHQTQNEIGLGPNRTADPQVNSLVL